MTSWRYQCGTDNNSDSNYLRRSGGNVASEFLRKLLAVNNTSNTCDEESQQPHKCGKSVTCSIGGAASQKAEKNERKRALDGVDPGEGRAW